MSAKILHIPKYNQREWDMFFSSLIAQVDRIAARHKFLSNQPTKAVNHEGGTGAVANRKPPAESANGGAAQSFSAPSFTCPCETGHPQDCLEHSQECDEIIPGYVGGGYIPDEPECSDSDTARELQENRGK